MTSRQEADIGLFSRSKPAASGAAPSTADPEQEAARHVDAGNAEEDAGRLERALASYDAAIRACRTYARGHLNRGNALAALGRHDEALASYQEALAHQPDYAGAHVNIGNLHLRRDETDAAIESYRRALAIDPAMPQVLLALGTALEDVGRLDDAVAALRDAIHRDPGLTEAHARLGNALVQRNDLSEALACFRKATEVAPSQAETWGNLGSMLVKLGRHDEAIAAFGKAVELKPDLVHGHIALGRALRECGRPADAVARFRRAIELDPKSFEAHADLAHALRDMGQVSASRAPFEQAVAINPRDPRSLTGLGCVLHELGLLDQAIEHHRRALEVDEGLVEVRNNLGNGLKDSGRLAEAIAEYRRVIRERPRFWSAHDNLLLTLNYTGDDPSVYLEAARTFGALLREATLGPYTSWSANPRPKRLRVGLVSGDLRGHPVGYFLEGLLAHCRHTTLDLYAYPTFGAQDELTARIRPKFAKWTPIAGMTDEAAARVIRDDGIHILIDLAGHTAHNRLTLFAWKPAPVQASWVGYFASTGVEGMDYMIGDWHVAPESESANFTETLKRLPDCYLCFTPPGTAVDVGPLPALANGYVTFGCFGNLVKINDDVVRAWVRVMREVPNARLLLKAVQLADGKMRERTLERFAAAGLPRDRLILEPPSPRAVYFSTYRRVDMVLDTFPFPGGTTTAEAYWMGVPTLTRKGDRFIARAGESFAHTTGMSDWIARDDDDYVAKAVAFAGDVPGLARLRQTLRAQVLASPLCDGARQARGLEGLLWEMWGERARTDAGPGQ
ncbi:MAG: tetratricopeptide repeat protein [Burkholderiales bacterium]